MANCKTCGQKIWYATHTKTGKTAPLDAVVSADGNCMTMNIDGKLFYDIIPPAERPQHAGKLRKNHWASCSKPPRKGGAAA